MEDSVREIIKKSFSQTEIASRLGCRQQTVNQWLNSRVPPKRVIPLCELLNWEITPHQLRPDIYRNITDGLPPKHKNTQRGGENLTYAVQP